MPVYHFHLHDGAYFPDEEGVDLADLDAARQEAVRHAGQQLKENPRSLWDGNEWILEVADSRGHVLFSLMFRAVSSPDTQPQRQPSRA